MNIIALLFPCLLFSSFLSSHRIHSELFLASKEGNATWVKALLAAGADIDGRDGVGCVSVGHYHERRAT